MKIKTNPMEPPPYTLAGFTQLTWQSWDRSIDIEKTKAKDFKRLQTLELDVGEINEAEFEQSLLEQSGEELPEGEIKVAPLNQFQAQSGFFRMRLAGDQ